MRKFLAYLLGAVLILACLLGLGAVYLSRLPDAIVYQSYPDRQCLTVDIVQDDEWERISCAKFSSLGGFTRDYATQWGGRPFD